LQNSSDFVHNPPYGGYKANENDSKIRIVKIIGLKRSIENRKVRNMSSIVNVRTSDNYRLLIDFEDGSKLTFNMQRMVETIPFFRLKDPSSFQSVKFDEKSVYWDVSDGKPEYLPLKLSIDTILFSLRN